MATAKFILKGDNQLEGTLKDASKDLNTFQQTVAAAGNVLSKAFAVTAIVAGLKELGSAVVDVAKEGSKFQSAIDNLQSALGASDREIKEFTKEINKLDDQTKSSRLDLISYAQSFKAFDLSTEQVQKLLKASVDLSNVTGSDLNTAISAVQKSLTGSTTALERMGVKIDGLTTAQLKNGEVADLLIEKYDDLNKALQEGDSQQLLDNISGTLTRIKQDLGTGIVDAISPALESLYGWLLKIEGWAESFSMKADIKNMLSNGATANDLRDSYSKSDLASLYKAGHLNGLTSAQIGILYEAAFGTGHGIGGRLPDVAGIRLNWGFTEPTPIDYSADARKARELAETAANATIYSNGYATDIAFAKMGFRNLVDGNPFGRNLLEPLFPTSYRGSQGTTDDALYDLYNPTLNSGRNEIDYSADARRARILADSANYSDSPDVFTAFGDSFMTIMATMESFKAVMNPLNTIMESFVTEIASFVDQLLKPLEDTLEWIGKALADTLKPVFEALMPVIKAITSLLQAVMMPILDILTEAFENVASGLLLITGTLEWAADWIRYAIGKVTFWTSNDDTDMPGSWSSYALDGGTSGGSMTTSTSTAISNAAYAGGNNITINIYQSGAVVGDSGMRQFAQMIKNEFDEMNYYGIA